MTTEIRFLLSDGSYTNWMDMQGTTPIYAPIDTVRFEVRNRENTSNVKGEITIIQEG